MRWCSLRSGSIRSADVVERPLADLYCGWGMLRVQPAKRTFMEHLQLLECQ